MGYTRCRLLFSAEMAADNAIWHVIIVLQFVIGAFDSCYR